MQRLLLVAALILAGVGFWIYSNSRVDVPADHQAVVLQFGMIHNIIKTPGTYYLKPFIQQVLLVNSGPRCFDVMSAEVLASDRNRETVDTLIFWQVVDPAEFVRAAGGDREIAEQRIDDVVYSFIKDTAGIYSIDSLMTDEYLSEVHSKSDVQLRSYGVEVLSIHFQTSDEDPCAGN